MSPEVTIFNEINSRAGFNYTGTQLADWSGLDKSIISRFLNGKADISASRFLQLISSMPTPFQQVYWSELLKLNTSSAISWRAAIAQASYADIEEILNALAERWGSLPNYSASRIEVDTVVCTVGGGV